MEFDGVVGGDWESSIDKRPFLEKKPSKAGEHEVTPSD